MNRAMLVQLFILIIGLAAGIGCASVFINTSYINTNGDTYIALQNGLDGMAIGLGLISAACMIGVAWIEVAKLRNESR